MIIFELFLIFFQIGLLSFGGGYAAVPLIEQHIIVDKGWLGFEEFINLITIAEMTPGPIGINTATFVGMQIGGILGAVVATTAYILPSFFIVLALAYLFNRYKSLNAVQGVLSGIRPCIVGLIASVGLSIFILSVYNESANSINFVMLFIFLASIALLRMYKKISPILIIMGAGLIGLCAYYLHLI